MEKNYNTHLDEEELKKLFSLPKTEILSPLGIIGYKKGEEKPIACYYGDHCHFNLSLSSGNIKNLSIFSFCIGYMLQRHEIFSIFYEYGGSFNISHDGNEHYTVNNTFKIRTFEFTLQGIGDGYIDRKEDSIYIFYQEETDRQPKKKKSYQFQLEPLEEDTLLHIYDERKRKLLESFLLEGKKNFEDIPFCDLKNKSLKKMFEGRKDENN